MSAASASPVVLAPRSVAPGDILFGCGPIQNALEYPGQVHAKIEQAQIDAAIHAALAAGIVDFDTGTYASNRCLCFR